MLGAFKADENAAIPLNPIMFSAVAGIADAPGAGAGAPSLC
jgi:hypothetical protein